MIMERDMTKKISKATVASSTTRGKVPGKVPGTAVAGPAGPGRRPLRFVHRPESALVRRVARAQPLRHMVANKVTLPLTVLREQHAGRAVAPGALALAIRDLEALMAWVDEQPTGVPPYLQRS